MPPAVQPEVEYAILSRLESNRQPSGSGEIAAHLRDAGMLTSPATVGRVLRLFDRQGYTLRVGFRGRALTHRGAERLDELRSARDGANWVAIAQSARPTTVAELLDVLVARRAIEREIARLAALRASDRDISALWAALEAQAAAAAEHGIAMEEDRRFHELLAATSGNRLLAATLRLIRRDVYLQRMLEEMRRDHASGFLVDHRAVVEAVSRHDPVAAEAAMLHHLEHLIDDVEWYCRTHPQGFAARISDMLDRIPASPLIDIPDPSGSQERRADAATSDRRP